MSKKTPITKIVRKTNVVAQATDRLSVVYRLMKDHSLAHVPVMDHHKVAGIISRKTIKQLGFGCAFDGHDDVEIGLFDMLQAGQVMVRDTPHVSLSATVGDVAELMAIGDYSALPAVHDGQVAGIIDINDIVRFLIKAC